MVGIGFPETYTQYGELKRGVKRNIDGKELLHRKNPFPKIGDIYSEATLTMLSSNRNPTFQFQFTDCYPIALSELKFDTTDETVNYITVSAAFKYHFYKVYRPE